MNETISSILRKALSDYEFKDAKDCAKGIGVSYELFRKVVAGGHVPKDEQLIIYAEKLGLDSAVLIRLAHYERAPEEAKKYLEVLLAANMGMADRHLKDQISHEELECLEKVLKVLRGQDIKAKDALEIVVDRLALAD